MAADLSQVRQQYVYGLQAAAKLVIQLNNTLAGLSNLYNGAGLSGSFVDSELAGNGNTKHLLGADIGTYTANLNTISTAMSQPILQNMEKAAGLPV